MSIDTKPRLLFLRFHWPYVAPFLKRHLDEHVRCLSFNFDVTVINDISCDYKQLCETHQPDIVMFESGSYVVPHKRLSNTSAYPEIPKVGFVHCDAFCETRKMTLLDMANYEVSTFFSNSVSMGDYTPSIADRLFTWPNFVDPDLYRDYKFPKVIPVLITGSQAAFYIWRSKIDRIVSQHYPTLHSPHFGWSWKKDRASKLSFLDGERYAQLINSSWVAPTCGTITNDVIRKHFEIPACNCCLLTQRTAALEAAGFVDLVNCVFADESDVVDKLAWLFDNPEMLDQITRAGKQLVDSRHQIQHRDQVYQWFTLHKKLGPGQKIVQPGPFQPLTVVEVNSGVKNGHVVAGGLDRRLLKQADEEMRLGRYEIAAKTYTRCLNYICKDYSEPRFGLILCWLHQGNAKAALAEVRDHFPPFRLNTKKGFEPDPTEWGWFIIVLLCCGKNREAALRAEQYPAIHNDELQRVRRVVQLLRGLDEGLATELSHTPTRVSVHQPPLAIDEWLEKLLHMLKACGQEKTASILEAGRSTLQSRVASKTSTEESKVTSMLAGPRTYLARMHRQLRSQAKYGPFGHSVVQHSVALAGRFRKFLEKNIARSQPLIRRISRYVPFSPPRIADNEWSAIVRLLQKEEVQSGVLIGAANGSWLSDAFMRGLKKNPNGPSAVCVNYNTREFRKFHRRYVDVTNVKFRYLPDKGQASAALNEKADVVAINCAKVFSDVRATAASASIVLLNAINDKAGSELFHAMLSDENYLLVAHEASHSDGYAIFRRAALRAA